MTPEDCAAIREAGGCRCWADDPPIGHEGHCCIDEADYDQPDPLPQLACGHEPDDVYAHQPGRNPRKHGGPMTEKRRTKRRYAHELYPHAEEGETRPLEVEVPYLYARAIGYDIWGTDCLDFPEPDPGRAGLRVNLLVENRRRALLADALLQGLAGQEAWEWADSRAWDESGGWTYDRAIHYGVPTERIKPYRHVSEPDHHDHYGEPDPRHGHCSVTRVAGKESECPDCTEPIPAGDGS